MNKKIKVIELINKIYANLDVPEKVKYHDIVFKYKESIQEYAATKGNVTSFLINNIICQRDNWLDVEVEILEDEEEMNIQELEDITYYEAGDHYEYNNNFSLFAIRIDDLVKAVKQLDKKINKEEM